ncbi:hypothetical protein QR680_019022 [Steinernema hermaphroditum]|uniref:Uncharacterized protein n=1 Tax=Steinernema hermaphroditum TaxID=289476 RepID=A0AA39LRY0_9BILA|nr:hypothetical protein QR680_019022 [Steinernema hermaphroditum]
MAVRVSHQKRSRKGSDSEECAKNPESRSPSPLLKRRKRSPPSQESRTAVVVNAPPAKIAKSIPKEEEDFWFDSGVGEDSPVKKAVKVITKKPGQGTLMKKSLKMYRNKMNRTF